MKTRPTRLEKFMLNENLFRDRLNKWEIPESMHHEIVEYAFRHQKPNNFFSHVLQDDLYYSVMLADALQLKALPKLLMLLHMEMPHEMWGSHENYIAWLKNSNSA